MEENKLLVLARQMIEEAKSQGLDITNRRGLVNIDIWLHEDGDVVVESLSPLGWRLSSQDGLREAYRD